MDGAGQGGEGEPGDAWARDTEQRLLDAAERLAPDVGWNARLVERAGREVGLTAAEADLLLPGGAQDLAALLSRRHEAVATAGLAAVDPTTLKIRERIRAAVLARLEAAAEQAAATRRWLGFLALPPNLPLAGRLLWERADGVWRWAGDTATDENHYSKRAIVSAILAAALPIRLERGPWAAESFVDARIADVMRYEGWKARRAPSRAGDRLAAALARVRYPR